jgi:uncharacterized membrane protein YcaP (DUF421 family)
MLQLSPYLPDFTIALRAISVYVFIIFAIRFFGKKELAQLSVVDLVFILLISNAVQNAMVGPDTSLGGGMLAAAALFLMNYIFKNLLFRSRKFSALIQGEPVLLVYKGRLKPENLSKTKITHEEIEAAAREHGVEGFSQIDLAVLEVDGNISILSHNFTHRSSRKRHHPKISKHL